MKLTVLGGVVLLVVLELFPFAFALTAGFELFDHALPSCLIKLACSSQGLSSPLKSLFPESSYSL